MKIMGCHITFEQNISNNFTNIKPSGKNCYFFLLFFLIKIMIDYNLVRFQFCIIVSNVVGTYFGLLDFAGIGLFFFLQIKGLWQPCIKQVYECHFLIAFA